MIRMTALAFLALAAACGRATDEDPATAAAEAVAADSAARHADSLAAVDSVRDYVRALIDALEDYRSEHGRIPDDLVVLGLVPPDSVPPARLEISAGYYTVSASHPRGFTCSANSDSLTVRCHPAGGCCGP